MTSAAPEILVRRGFDRGLFWTIVCSAILHAAAVLTLIALPGHFLPAPQRMESYTVDLVAPGTIGGTNLIAGSGQPAKAPPNPPPVPVKGSEGPPAPVKLAEPLHELPKPPPDKIPAAAEKPVEVPKPEPAKLASVAPAAKPAPPPPKPVAAKVEEPKPAPHPEAVTKPAPPAQLPKPPAPAAKVAAKPVAERNVEVHKPASSAVPKPAGRERPAVKTREQQIADAVRRRAAEVQQPQAQQSELDQRIAAAVAKRAAEAASSGDKAGPGGPVGVGPGSGVGGTTAGLDYILYHGRMIERIKAAWAWAGADKSLHAVVEFNITPEGEIRNVHTTEPSGDPQYDASAERAVRAVDPLDPVPERYRKEFSTVELTFQASDLER
jgi:TonB family protein